MKTDTTNNLKRPLAKRRRRRGFSALELTAVSTIMAILSLLVVQNLTKAVAKSRIKAAGSEMESIGGILTFAYGETSRWYPLQLLDNTSSLPGAALLQSPYGVPTNYYHYTPKPPSGNNPSTWTSGNSPWNVITVADNGGERASLAKMWKGPYTNFNKSITMSELRLIYPTNTNGPNCFFIVTTM